MDYPKGILGIPLLFIVIVGVVIIFGVLWWYAGKQQDEELDSFFNQNTNVSLSKPHIS
ncbi:MAG: hypothetical protein AAB445_02360 [Patescibacteria group bacterium]